LAAIETNYWVQRAIRTFSDLTANIWGGLNVVCGILWVGNLLYSGRTKRSINHFILIYCAFTLLSIGKPLSVAHYLTLISPGSSFISTFNTQLI